MVPAACVLLEMVEVVLTSTGVPAGNLPATLLGTVANRAGAALFSAKAGSLVAGVICVAGVAAVSDEGVDFVQLATTIKAKQTNKGRMLLLYVLNSATVSPR